MNAIKKRVNIYFPYFDQEKSKTIHETSVKKNIPYEYAKV